MDYIAFCLFITRLVSSFCRAIPQNLPLFPKGVPRRKILPEACRRTNLPECEVVQFPGVRISIPVNPVPIQAENDRKRKNVPCRERASRLWEMRKAAGRRTTKPVLLPAGCGRVGSVAIGRRLFRRLCRCRIPDILPAGCPVALQYGRAGRGLLSGS